MQNTNNTEGTKSTLELVELMITNIKIARVARDKETSVRLYSKRFGAQRFGKLLWVRSASQALLIKQSQRGG